MEQLAYQIESLKACIRNIPFPVCVKHPFELILSMGPQALHSEATYVQMTHNETGKYHEGIIFNGAFFKGLESVLFWRVLFHELAHATGSAKRLNRQGVNLVDRQNISKRAYAIEELIAERTSQKVMAYFGILDAETEKVSNQYLELYSNVLNETGEPKTEFDSARIERDSDAALAYILQNWFPISQYEKKAA